MSSSTSRTAVRHMMTPRSAGLAVNLLAATVVSTLLAGSAMAQTATTAEVPAGKPPEVSKVGPSPTSMGETLRICASTKEAPFSMEDGTGFENRIGEALAKGMGRKADFVWTEKNAIYLVRDGLDKKTCDVVLGLDTDDGRVATSKPYYRTGYAFVSRTADKFTGTRWQDVGEKGLTRFSSRLHSPADVILKYAGKYEDNLAYLYALVDFKSRRNQYSDVPPERIVSEVQEGKANIGIVFAPEAARYVKASNGALAMTLIENSLERENGVTMALQYDQSVGVRKGDDALLKAVNDGLAKAAPDIAKILADEGIPLLPVGS